MSKFRNIYLAPVAILVILLIDMYRSSKLSITFTIGNDFISLNGSHKTASIVDQNQNGTHLMQHGNQSTVANKKENENPSSTMEEKIVLITFLLGREAAMNRPFRLFVESARTAGVDFAVVGDSQLPYELPDNFQFFNITWNAFVGRAFERLANGKEVTKLRKADPSYKIRDFKPVMGYLFPEIVDGYSFWGHIDNNMLCGNLAKFLPQDLLQSNDIISGNPNVLAWNAFMLYRNIPVVNELFKLAPRPVKDSLLNRGYHHFDAWRPTIREKFENLTMTGIIRNEGPRLGLRVHSGTTGEYLTDGHECPRKYSSEERIPQWCGECVYDQGKLLRGTDGKELALCHLYASKDTQQYHDSLRSDEKLQHLIETRQFRWG